MWKVASPQIDQRFEPNTVLWAFHTIQPSSFQDVNESLQILFIKILWLKTAGT